MQSVFFKRKECYNLIKVELKGGNNMELKKAWQKFVSTGKVKDYLSYVKLKRESKKQKNT